VGPSEGPTSAPAGPGDAGSGSDEGAGSALDPALLERFRQSGLSIDREGQFWHAGQPVTHLGMRRAFFRWLDRLPPPDGRHILRLDDQRFVYIEVADTPLVATSLRWSGDRALLGLSDGNEEALDAETLTVDDQGILRCRVRGGRLEARLTTSAAAALGERIESSRGGAVLHLGGRELPLKSRRE
jgi:hypothetical protein